MLSQASHQGSAVLRRFHIALPIDKYKYTGYLQWLKRRCELPQLMVDWAYLWQIFQAQAMTLVDCWRRLEGLGGLLEELKRVAGGC